MENLLSILQQAKDERVSIKLSEVHDFITAISLLQSDLNYDWDEWSGEEWLTLLIDNARVAMICIKIPIIFVSEQHNIYIQTFDLIKKLYKVIIKDFDECIWSIDLNKYKSLFPELEWHASEDAVDVTSFSTNEFWFATI